MTEGLRLQPDPLRISKPPAHTTRSPAARPTWHRIILSLRYLFRTEVHAYAFSIAANALLSFFPFAMILLTLCRNWLHWESAYAVILELLKNNLPAGGEFVIRNLTALVAARGRVKLVSVLMLVFTSSGVFLPLEIALNRVWGVTKNRDFIGNLAVSFALALAAGGLALFSIAIAAIIRSAARVSLWWFPWHRAAGALFRVILESVSVPLTIAIYFVIYYFLPNRKVPLRSVLPAAVLAGILTEVGRIVYAVTLPLFGFREIYGPFSLSVTLLFWAFVGSLILLWGAHFSAQTFYDDQPHGDAARSNPSSFREAVPLTESRPGAS